MCGPGRDRSGFGWGGKDGHWRSPLNGENRKVISGGGVADLTDRSVPYEPDPAGPDLVLPVSALPRRWRWSWVRQSRRARSAPSARRGGPPGPQD